MKEPFVAKGKRLIKLLMYTVLFFTLMSAWASEPASPASQGGPATEVLYKEAEQELKGFLSTLSGRERAKLIRYTWREHWTLSPKQQKLYERWFRLSERKNSLKKTVELKKDLLALHPEDQQSQQGILNEADQIARQIIDTLSEYRKKWTMIRPALLHNFMVNIGVKKKGFCWHWVDLFQGRLTPLGIEHFQFYWGVAYEGKIRENNALVITRPGGPFEKGIAIDGWRRSGRPFWVTVKDDKFPWVERID